MVGRITVSKTFSTSASPSAVWAALEAAPRWPEVLTDLVSARIEPDGMLVDGATIRTIARPGTRAIDMTYRVVAADPRLSLTIESEVPGLRARSEYLIAPFVTGARVTMTSEIEAVNWLDRIRTALARLACTAQVEANLEVRTRAILTLAGRIQQG
jgi:hypothetical protein